MPFRDVARPAASRSQLVVGQAVAALRAGDQAEAQRLLREQIAVDPLDSAALTKLAEIGLDQGRLFESAALLRRAVGARPDDPGPRLALANLLERQGEFGAALAELEGISEPARSSVLVRATEAALLGKLGRHGPEIALYRGLVGDHPGHEALWKNYGNALKTVGRIEEAVDAFRTATRIRPAYGEAWWSLANLKTVRFDDRDIRVMRKSLKGKLRDGDGLHLHFALGKAFEGRGEPERSFRHYAAGNQLRSAGLTPQETNATLFVNRAIATFDRALFDRLGEGGNPTRDPIFVVGLQRSGSTLVEQILASHPEIEGTAELTELPRLWMRLASGGDPFDQVARLDPAARAELGAEYLERTKPYRLTDRPLFIDKLPGNWMHVGFIRLILPKARIIDARRHPMACGFSNFSQHYASGVTFAYSLETIGRFYADYLRLMNHFDRTVPGAVYHLINERLIDNTEGEIRRLLDHVGVPFDAACLDFHRNPRAVRTPSAEQVRRPINRDGVDGWRAYQPWLGSLEDALGEALQAWDCVGS